MRDIAIALFVLLLVVVAFTRPWLATITYLYADLLQPQRLSYYLFQGVPLNLILGIVAVVFFIFDRKKNLRFNIVQGLILAFVVWFTFTSTQAIIQDAQVWTKWDPAWKGLLFGGVFLPFVLSTRRRIETAIAFFVICVSLVTISAGLKTAAGGGGYGNLSMIVDVNKGLYESSTISTVAIAMIPLAIYLYYHSPLIGRTRLTLIGLIGTIVCAILTVIGTEARTGLVCIAFLAIMLWWSSRQRLVILVGAVAVSIVALPLLPQSFIERMGTITRPTEDSSANTRLVVWTWAFNFVKDHPLGGGFRVSRLTEVDFKLPIRNKDGIITGYRKIDQQARAFHSSYIEVMAEHGWPGLALYMSIIGVTLAQLQMVRRRHRKDSPDREWLPALAQGLFRAIAIYAVGGLFVGIAFQTTLYVLIGISVAFCQLAASYGGAEKRALRKMVLRVPQGRSPVPAQ